jgi:hypothetical protein
MEIIYRMKLTCTLALILIFITSCNKESITSNSTSSIVEIKYEIISNTTIIPTSTATYTNNVGNVIMDNNISGTSWSKIIKLPKGTLVQFETILTLTGTSKSATAAIYANGAKKVSMNSIGNSVNNITIAGTTLQYVID